MDAPKPAPRTLYEKLWDAHVVAPLDADSALLHIDRQLLHEVSSPQAFAEIEGKGLAVARPAAHLGLADHAVPTRNRDRPIADPKARAQVALHAENCARHGIDYLSLDDARQGIVHIVGPEQGFTLPGITLVCGDSHTATHGAFGALAFGIGTSECACVLATGVLPQRKARTMAVELRGRLGDGVGAKDVILALIARIGASGAAGHAIEYRGAAVAAMSMEARMTLCNMSIEAGSRTGLIAPDATTLAYVEGRPRAPKGADWTRAAAYWRTLSTDAGAAFDRVETFDVSRLAPMVTWGTSPDQGIAIDAGIPAPATVKDRQALDYMGLTAGQRLAGTPIDAVFIGSCTNSRIEDLRAAAAVVRGRRVAAGVQALVVPGSGLIKRQAEEEGLDRVFTDAGFSWRDAGCSLCVAMNDDRLASGTRCASTSNRNFEGRQGAGARTHLMSPAMAAAAAVTGRIVDVRTLG
ncbi:3-isopropylmalate dehydratase large subunit [Sphingomonas hengshuiensis]|uniref:3-isopropylmalate dehydratase large subunit n=1 Tax=Sphingomonas hengshuiensis TaxID=1609977 RepID=A0A7U4LG02_9SPHN|nr:3-isopropylmalate dehydratase large subunit [Sphingomonas hengshuiensis]AJP72793.1 isopropylmalate isomerase [Sphingomonas hengshuiensis]